MWHVLAELGEPLGASEKEMNSRYYSAMTLWTLQLKLYLSSKTHHHLLAFYDVLEALVKKTLYRPQTLDKIYNNASKETLISGLTELWEQRAHLAMDTPEYVDKIEDLRYYYNSKKRQHENPEYVLIKARMPTVVWLILRICKELRRRVKLRKTRLLVNPLTIQGSTTHGQKKKESADGRSECNTAKEPQMTIKDISPEIVTEEEKKDGSGSGTGTGGPIREAAAEETGRALIGRGERSSVHDLDGVSECNEQFPQQRRPRVFWDADSVSECVRQP